MTAITSKFIASAALIALAVASQASAGTTLGVATSSGTLTAPKVSTPTAPSTTKGKGYTVGNYQPASRPVDQGVNCKGSYGIYNNGVLVRTITYDYGTTLGRTCQDTITRAADRNLVLANSHGW